MNENMRHRRMRLMKISSPPSSPRCPGMKGAWHRAGGGGRLIPKRVGGGGGVDAHPPKKGEGRVLPV
jgi:hypothetical protein